MILGGESNWHINIAVEQNILPNREILQSDFFFNEMSVSVNCACWRPLA